MEVHEYIGQSTAPAVLLIDPWSWSTAARPALIKERVPMLDSLRSQVADQKQWEVVWWVRAEDYADVRSALTSALSSSTGSCYLPNKARLGGAEETFIAGTARGVPTIGTASTAFYTGTTYAGVAGTSCTAPVGTIDQDCLATLSSYLRTPPESDLDVTSSYPALAALTYFEPQAHTSPTAPASPGAVLPIDLLRPGTQLLPLAPPIEAAPRVGSVIRIDLSEGLQRDLLRLIDGIRSALRLALILFRAVFTRRPAMRRFVLIMLAASRRYGRRGEPDDHLLPDRRPMSVVRGGLVLAA